MMPLEQLVRDNFLFFLLLMIWSLIWKGLALWRAAHTGNKRWFVVFLIFNTVGILEIIYLYFLNKDDVSDKQKTGL